MLNHQEHEENSEERCETRPSLPAGTSREADTVATGVVSAREPLRSVAGQLLDAARFPAWFTTSIFPVSVFSLAMGAGYTLNLVYSAWEYFTHRHHWTDYEITVASATTFGVAMLLLGGILLSRTARAIGKLREMTGEGPTDNLSSALSTPQSLEETLRAAGFSKGRESLCGIVGGFLVILGITMAVITNFSVDHSLHHGTLLTRKSITGASLLGLNAISSIITGLYLILTSGGLLLMAERAEEMERSAANGSEKDYR